MRLFPAGVRGSNRFITHLRSGIFACAALACLLNIRTVVAQEAQWIWSSAAEKDKVPAETCYFRKTFEMGRPEEGEVEITADDSYELFVNGRSVGTGNNWRQIDVVNITKYLTQGRNLIAVKATSATVGRAGLAVRVSVKEAGNTFIVYPSDNTWKAALKEFVHWEKLQFNDSQWVAAKSWGEIGMTLPWGDESVVAGRGKSRFTTPADFEVQYLNGGKSTGSLISMAFNEQGNLLAAREKGPLLILRDQTKSGKFDTIATYCDQITNCHGMLCLNNKVYAVGTGPEGDGLYKLTDTANSGKIDKVERLLKFNNAMVEHGAHAPILGPDGLIYIVIGNHGAPDKKYEPTSPLQHYYEGDLFTPRYEDPSGHAANIKAPGGVILRTDAQGSFVELFAGGFRNCYRMAFNRNGELFTWDSDMEWDEGLSWYRPTRLLHVTPGAEFGWRSGWTNWHDYYLDSLPSMLDTGRGSPTGVVSYNHVMLPVRYHGALFVGDWARGRILAVKLKPSGGSFTAESETLVEGRPLNVTDLAVGPDGAVYFCTGGRDTEGGVYRIRWLGKVPAAVTEMGTGITAALRQPQLDSAWARHKVAAIKHQLGKEWEPALISAAENTGSQTDLRVRALTLMQLLGPFPKPEWLNKMAADRDPLVRAKVAYLLGIHGDDTTKDHLVRLLSDADPDVQRVACESLVRVNQQPPLDKLLPLLASPQRHLASAARNVLEQLPREEWQSTVLKSENQRVFLQGAVALLASNPDKAVGDAIVNRARQLMRGYVADGDFLDLLRVFELALSRAPVKTEEYIGLGRQIADEYPAKDLRMNRELIRLLVLLQEPSFLPRMIEQLNMPEVPLSEKLHAAFHSRFLTTGWDTKSKLEVLKFYEQARSVPGGHSLNGYIENISRDFFASLTEDERMQVLASGAKWPSSALSVLARIPAQPGAEVLAQLQHLDEELLHNDSDAAKKLGIGIVAVLARSGDEKAMAYLREVYEHQPERRLYIAMALAQHPEGENWNLLVRSLPILEGAFAQEVLIKLAKVDRVPEGSEPIRQVILRGLKLGDRGAVHAINLLENWTDQELGEEKDPWDKKLALWQAWFAKKYPDQPEATLPSDDGGNHWTYEELNTFLSGPEAKRGSAIRGAAIFNKALCAKCHRFGQEGESVGPDLTTVTQRFQTKEIIESVLFPSQVIADRYQSKSIVMKDGRIFAGLVSPQGDDSVTIMQSDLQKITVSKDEIDTMATSKKSAMPEGLFNKLTLEEIADLFAYLNQSSPSAITRRNGRGPTEQPK
ncbi:MAG TPA: HEAT repeat domain-containing protein [Pirellulales bacterium]|jgi:putative heme-binding domain-containing protein|nr:HEAT repeat domain-containing protein [Pirellulales bacterium]